jgi:hypothetical protein
MLTVGVFVTGRDRDRLVELVGKTSSDSVALVLAEGVRVVVGGSDRVPVKDGVGSSDSLSVDVNDSDGDGVMDT